MRRAAVFLDRDGVINRAPCRRGRPHPPAGLHELEILPDVPEALRALKAGGYALIVVTNQPDVARGTRTRREVEDIHRRLERDLAIDAILCCFHDGDSCGCRKPRPGLLLQAARDFAIELPSSFMVGDRWSDIEAGRRAGCGTFFVDRGYQETRPEHPDHRVRSLGHAADIILAESHALPR
ncbi:MAG TPA: HAD family hydrolase [Steroidobacteraceae bacterium]|jgi:D-glycero-D-manno-heptose 1,7-bisphosphate phosphatase|nr:HAD family hydrolase [Steroidobacteraceae bacterium]